MTNRRPSIAAIRLSLIAAALLIRASGAQGLQRTWNAGGDQTNWFDADNWDPTGVPAAGDGAVVSSGAILLSNTTAYLTSFTITNATLTFTNWTTELRATQVVLRAGATLTHTRCTTNLLASNSNRVALVCSNLTVEAGGLIDVNTQGYDGGILVNHGYGPGAGGQLSGGGYGGRGGYTGGGPANGSLTAPTSPGSGGGGHTSYATSKGGPGGGSVQIIADGHVLINGTVTANGGRWSGSYGGGGSGGGIYITCATFGGTNGLLRANGGTGGSGNCGGGGGGRIALDVSDTTAQNTLPRPSVQFSTDVGTSANQNNGQLGTVHFGLRRLLQDTLLADSNGRHFGFTNWAADTLTLNGGWVGLMEDGATVTVTNDLRILGSGSRLDLTNATLTVGGDILVNAGYLAIYGNTTGQPSLSCSGDMTLSNSAAFRIGSGVTNDVTPDHGGSVDVTGTLSLGSGCVVYPHSHPTNGGSVLFTVADLSMASDAHINANALGFADGPGTAANTPGYGPGRGGPDYHGGAGHGGKGTLSGTGYGLTYGASNAPVHPGSGGGTYSTSQSGHGGGVVRMEIANTAAIHGTITADGGNWSGSYGSGGSGGSIYLQADTFAVTAGDLTARGGKGSWGNQAGGGSGGGGRIALYYRINGLVVTPDVSGGIGGYNNAQTGEVGTVYFTTVGGYLQFRVYGSPDLHGTPTPFNYGENGVFSGSWITNSAASPADESNGVRYVCTGWTMTNANGASANGTTTQATFQVTTNTDMTWYWKQQNHLTCTAATNGSLLVDQTGWHPSTSLVSVTALPDGGRAFLQWTGSGVPPGAYTNNPLALLMDRPRTVEARFANATPTTRTWNGTGNWFSETNWSSALGAGIPNAGDDVVIQSGICSADEPLYIAALSVGSGATLLFTNWHTVVTVAGDVTVESSGTITHAGPFRNADMSNRVAIACADLTVDAGGTINVNAVGYHGGVQGSLEGHGPGGGRGSIAGAGHGGRGGKSTGGLTYGSIQAPVQPGSGGAGYTGTGAGGHGGGAVRIDASGRVTVNGSITANGGNYLITYGAGASGGSVFITCATFDGTGIVRADGGDSSLASTGVSGSGGGRIAIIMTNVTAQQAMPRPTASFRTDIGNTVGERGEPGTIYFGGINLLPEALTSENNGRYYGISDWAPSSLTIDNAWIGFMDHGLQLAVTNALALNGASSRLDLSNATISVGSDVRLNGGDLYVFAGPSGFPALTCAGDAALSNSATCHVYSGPTNPPTHEYGATVSVAGDITVASGSLVGLHTCATNGGAPFVTARNVLVETNARIHADAAGYAGAGGGVGLNQDGYGPGGGEGFPGGGGYGGRGARNSGGFGQTYGSSNAPVNAGSGGGMYSSADRGGSGGGVVRLDVLKTLTVDGTISSDGGNWSGSYGGGGSGGSVYLTVSRLAGGADGRLRATGGIGSTGGSGGGGGGGGGRIAVAFKYSQFAGTTDVSGGIGGVGGVNLGETGTLVWTVLPPQGSVFLLR